MTELEGEEQLSSVDFARYDARGVILFVGNVPASMLQFQTGPIVVGSADAELDYVVDGKLVRYSPEELAAKRNIPPGFAWKMPERRLVDLRTLDEVRAQAWDRVKAGRTAALAQHFEVGGAIYQADVVAVTMAALQAVLDPALTTDWRLADNSLVTLDAAAMRAVAGALVARNEAIRRSADALRQQIETASRTEADEIGWPD